MSKPLPPPPPPPPSGAPPPSNSAAPGAATGALPFTSGRITGRGQRTVLYGEHGAGKSTLLAQLPRAVTFDLEAGTHMLPIHKRLKPSTFAELRAMLANPELDAFEAISIDTGGTAETMATAHVLTHKKLDGGGAADNLESFGWGKGYRYLYDQYALLLADLDRHAEAGRHVCVVCHAEVFRVPNPEGEDWIRWEPSLQNRSGANIRSLAARWADHLLYLGKDVLAKDGKGRGGTTRTLYATETATYLAKSRRLRDSLVVEEGDAAVWSAILG